MSGGRLRSHRIDACVSLRPLDLRPRWGGRFPESLKIVLLMVARFETCSKYQVAHLSQTVTEEAIVADAGRDPKNDSAGWTYCFHG